MKSTISRSSLDTPGFARGRHAVIQRGANASALEHVHPRRGHTGRSERCLLARYAGVNGRPREIVARPGAASSLLVIDRDAVTLGDRRLVAHLGADEPPENAAVACRSYLQQARRNEHRCRPLTAEDFRTDPFADDLEEDELVPRAASVMPLLDNTGRSYRLECVDAGMSIPELRWRRRTAHGQGAGSRSVSTREAIGALESYEPVRALTRRALAQGRRDGTVSTAVIRVELARTQESPIVLNRGLRESVLAAVERQGVSMSEIAMRCGRIKRDRDGNESGETSWLARRLGLLPEGGRDLPTPWIHTDVLALIARRGLGISPRETELQ
jgi:hypothetical protein